MQGERKTPKSEGSLHSRLKELLFLQKQPGLHDNHARVRVCVCVSAFLSAHTQVHVLKLIKTHTIEGFLLFGSRGRGSYFVVH